MTAIPRGIKTIFWINNGIIFALLMALHYYGTDLRQQFIFGLFACSATLAGLVLFQIIILFRLKLFLRFIRLLIYTLAIVQGLMIMLVMQKVFTALGASLIVCAVLLVIYFIGLRGYLISATTLQYFGFTNTDSNTQSSNI